MKWHVISAAHVTHPFLFPNLYPEEFPRFLSFLKESDVRVTLQLRRLDVGSLLAEYDLRRRYFVKKESDLVVAHLHDEAGFEENLLHKFDTNVEVLELLRPNSSIQGVEDEAYSAQNLSIQVPKFAYNDNRPASKDGAQAQDDGSTLSKVLTGESYTIPAPTFVDLPLYSDVELVGHDFAMNQNGTPVLVPTSLAGTFMGSSKKRIVVDTPQPSVMGLCGGPVLLVDSCSNQATSKVIGMVEGRINAPTQLKASSAAVSPDNDPSLAIHKALNDRTVLVSATEIGSFVDAVVEKALFEDRLIDQYSTSPLSATPQTPHPFSLDTADPSFDLDSAGGLHPTQMNAGEVQEWKPSATIPGKVDDDVEF